MPSGCRQQSALSLPQVVAGGARYRGRQMSLSRCHSGHCQVSPRRACLSGTRVWRSLAAGPGLCRTSGSPWSVERPQQSAAAGCCAQRATAEAVCRMSIRAALVGINGPGSTPVTRHFSRCQLDPHPDTAGRPCRQASETADPPERAMLHSVRAYIWL